MTSVFLSYAREDANGAQAIATALEGAGYQVWWDRHIHAGATFAAEIEAALDKADAVVVLWSRHAVHSTWVHDEAAAGRDSGRLIPLVLDGTLPPLGFRQFQGVDLSRWRGRGKPPHFAEITQAIDRAGGGAGSEPLRPVSRPGGTTASYSRLGRWQLPAFTLALAAAALIFLQWVTRADDSSVPTVAVVAAATSDSRQSREMARMLANNLSQLQTGSAGSLTVLGDGKRGSATADYRVEVGFSTDPGVSRADLTLLIPGNANILWSASFDRRPEEVADLRQQAAVELAAVLSCLVDANASKGEPLDPEILEVHLDGCARLSDPPDGPIDENAASIYRSITESAPRFAQGWANLALIEANAIPGSTSAERRALWPKAIEHAERALRLDPTVGEIYAAQAGLTFPDEWGKKISLLDRGLKADPGNSRLLGLRADVLTKVGRMNEAVDSARRAFDRDPLSPAIRDAYISSLAYSGRPGAALKQLQEAEKVWPGATTVRDARYRFDLRYGDPANALRLLKERGVGDLRPISSDPSWETFLLARMKPSPKNVEAAISAFVARYRSDTSNPIGTLQALGTFGRIEQAYQILEPAEAIDGLSGATEVLFRPDMRGFRSDPRFMRLAYRLKLLAFWRQTRVWPDYCSDPALPYDCEKEAAKYLSGPAN